MSVQELITVTRHSDGTWCINGLELVWRNFPENGIAGVGYYPHEGDALIKPVWASQLDRELAHVTISTDTERHGETEFFLTKRQFITHFIGHSRTSRVFEFKDELVNVSWERRLFEPLHPLCE